METFIVHLHDFFGWVIHMSYEASVLICLIILLQLLVGKKLGARWHYWLWLLLIFRMSMPWTPSSPVSMFKIIPSFRSEAILTAHSSAVQERPLVNYDSYSPGGVDRPEAALETGTTSELPGQIQDEETGYSANPLLQKNNILPLVWLVGAFIFGFYVFTSNFRLWRIIRCQRPLTQQKVLDLLEDCKNQMNVQTVIAVVATDKVKSPALFGFLRPRLLLPNGMIEDFSYDQLRYVFLHELAHLKRHDIFIGWLMAILQILHWFNPLVYLAFHRMRADRELACDGLTLSQMNVDEPKLYGRTIVKLLEKFSQFQILPAVAGILESKSQMKRRITMIAQFKKGAYRPSIGAVIFILILGIVVLTSPEVKSEVAGKSGDSKALAGEFVELLLKEEYGRARESFDSKLKDGMSEAQLQETWGGILEQAGAFKKQLGVRKQKFLASDILFVTCEFENGPLDVKIVFDASKNITGLTFVPTPEDVLESYQKEPAERTPLKDIGPIVLETTPTLFANDVKPGYQKISVTFDRPMMTQSWSWVGSGEMFPEIKGKPSYDVARRKCTISTKLEPGKVYRIGINSPSHKFFQTPGEVPAVPYVILFATKDKDGNPTPIPEKYISEAKQINAVTESARSGGGRESSALKVEPESSTLSIKDAAKKNYLGQTNFPKIVKLEPANNTANVDPVLEFITVTFDRPMRGGYSWVDKGSCPKMEKIEWINNQQCRAWVKLEPDKAYGVWLNFGPNTCKFKSEEGISTDRTYWHFRTTSKSGKQSSATPVEYITKKNYLGQTNFPEIVKLEPANNSANVDPGLEYITVTFDRPMRGGYSWVNKGKCPKVEKIEWIDEFNCRAWVKLEPNKVYGLWLNFGPNTCKFKSKEGISADRKYWQFRTTRRR